MHLSRLLALLCLLIVPLTTLLSGFSDGPLPQLTGGFQEETCHSCHNSFPLNEGRTRGGMFLLSGVPTHYQSGSLIAMALTSEKESSTVRIFALTRMAFLTCCSLQRFFLAQNFGSAISVSSNAICFTSSANTGEQQAQGLIRWSWRCRCPCWQEPGCVVEGPAGSICDSAPSNEFDSLNTVCTH